ncbi:hypothetical protein [Rhodanobacter sp. L36]|uniref:hypothetical protein n=1 Tax=Rhodanobacter sp. L36 TaxID=1747221 RepID=UPI00131CD839|nr:hypothetical protein [Rhodanobacter sp. L36]
MQRSATRFNPVHRVPLRVTLALALAGVIVATGSLHAQVLVTDVPAESAAATSATANTSTASFSSAMSAFQTGAQYTTLLGQLTQLTSTLSSIASNPIGAIIPNTNTMTELSDSTKQQLIQGKCYSATSGGMVSGVLQGLSAAVSSINLSGNITQTQQQICSGIVTAQVDEYNATVDLYQQVPQLRSSSTALQGLVQQMNGIMGNSSSSTAQTVAFTAQQQTTLTDWQTRVKMDESIISTLNQQQSTLSAIALKGNPNILGDAIQATALKSALSIND